MSFAYTSVLTIAGSDSGGGAGIQADLKTFAALGCYGTSAIMAVTAQNTLGISDIFLVPPNIAQAQIRSVLEDIPPLAIKIGMVPTYAHAIAVADALAGCSGLPIVFDPVLAASSGERLATSAQSFSDLIRIASLITPNLPEVEALCGFPVRHPEEMVRAAKHLLSAGANAVLVKGGHLPGDRVCDIYVDQSGGESVFESSRIDSTNLHGTGCTLSAAIAAFLALGAGTLPDAIASARAYLLHAIERGKDIRTGKGQGPLNHFARPLPPVLQRISDPHI